MRTPIPMSLLLIALTLLPACGRHESPASFPVSIRIPDAFSESGDGNAPERWWTAFEDPALDGLVESVLAGNLDLSAAWHRLDQARALARSGRAARRVQADLNVSPSRAKSVFLFGGDPRAAYVTQTDLSASASYEADLWGRLRAAIGAGKLDARASREDLETLAMGLVAQTADAWFSLVEGRSQKHLLDAQIRASHTFLELLELRFGQGLANSLDVYQQRTQLAALRAQQPQVEGELALLGHQLAVLQGRPPRSAAPSPETTTLPIMPPLPATGLPAELLVRRPDVRSALLRLQAADRRVAAAVADRLPKLSFTPSTGFRAGDFSSLFSSWIWSLAGRLSLPLFDGGRRRAEVARNKALVAERWDQFSQSMLLALREVEDALQGERNQELYLRQIEEQLRLAERTLEEARRRYLNGLSDYLPVLTALQAQQNLQRTRLTAWRQTLSHRIKLHRALGGGWTSSLEAPLPGASSGRSLRP